MASWHIIQRVVRARSAVLLARQGAKDSELRFLDICVESDANEWVILRSRIRAWCLGGLNITPCPPPHLTCATCSLLARLPFTNGLHDKGMALISSKELSKHCGKGNK